MGDLIGDVVDTELYFAPRSEFERIRRLNAPEAVTLALYADMARLNALYMIAKAGSGHIGSSFSAIDILTQLYLRVLDRAAGDVFFSSKGHDAPALYSVLIAEGVLEEDKLHALRRLGGLPGHPDISIPGLVTNTGSLGMGISKAKGMVLANRLKGHPAKVVVMTGDGELQEGQIWESLATAVHRRMSELTVVVDHNKFQSDFSVQRTSALGDLEAKFASFGWHVARVDGHDHEALAACFRSLQADTERPKVVIADTIKGRGVSFMEGTAIDSDVDMFRFHSGAPKADEYQRAVEEIEARMAARLASVEAAAVKIERAPRPNIAPAGDTTRLFPAYSKALAEAAERLPDLVALDADLALDMGLLEFASRFPGRFFECGIAEQDMVSQAGGMALKGLLPVVHSFSCFLATRPNEQIYNNATERSRIVYVGGLSGVLPAGPGHSHQSVREISAIGGIPNLAMVEPCTADEVAPLLRWCLESHDGPSFLRLVSVPFETAARLPAGYRVRDGVGTELHPGGDGVIVAAGLVAVAQALSAAQALSGQGIEMAVVNLPFLNRVDRDWLAALAGRYPAIVTIDNHFLAGGQGQMVLAAVAGLALARPPRCLAIGLHDVPPSGRNDEVLRHTGLDAAGLAARIEGHLRSGGDRPTQ